MVAADGAFLAELYDDPDVARHVGGDRVTGPAAHAQAERFAAEWVDHGWGQSVVERLGEPIGRVGLHRWPQWDEVELGWVLAARWQGRGMAAEAARAWIGWAREHRPAASLTADGAFLAAENHPSRTLAARLGFVLDRHDRTPWGAVEVHRLRLSAASPPAGPSPRPG